MMWQDLVFLAGSVLSIVFLAPTVRDSTARIPLGSSVPSMTIGAIYSVTYATMGMTFSAAGSLGVATMWSLIVCYRAPRPQTGPKNVVVFAAETLRRAWDLAVGAFGDDPAPTRSDHGQSAD